jgi:transcriptional regulator with XRE-family HTH domain
VTLDGLEPWTRAIAAPLILAEQPDPLRVLGRAIRRWRRRIGWTQDHLALVLCVAVQNVRAWERGASRPREVHMLAMLAHGFHRPRVKVERGRRDKPGSLLRRPA